MDTRCVCEREKERLDLHIKYPWKGTQNLETVVASGVGDGVVGRILTVVYTPPLCIFCIMCKYYILK